MRMQPTPAEGALAAGDLATASTLPPRPNLGPDPWPEPEWPPAGALVSASLVLLVTLALAAVAIRRRRRRPWPDPPDTNADAADSDTPTTPAERLMHAAATVRAALILRFGEPWGAKTTEEIAAESALSEALGVERASEIIRLLARADVIRFAGLECAYDEGRIQCELEAWEALAAEVREAAAGAKTTTNGRWSDPIRGPRRRSTTASSGETSA